MLLRRRILCENHCNVLLPYLTKHFCLKKIIGLTKTLGGIYGGLQERPICIMHNVSNELSLIVYYNNVEWDLIFDSYLSSKLKISNIEKFYQRWVKEWGRVKDRSYTVVCSMNHSKSFWISILESDMSAFLV
jgi:hypothetical protein